MALALALVALTGCGSKSIGWSVGDSEQAGLPPVSFHFDYATGMVRMRSGPGAYVKFEKRRGGVLVESFEVSPLSLKGQTGPPTAYLPLLIERYRRAVARRYPSARFVQEGRAKVNTLPGYQIFFIAKNRGPGDGELDGRVVLLPQYDLKKGVVLTALAGPASGFDRYTLLGTKGNLKSTFESFGFGA